MFGKVNKTTGDVSEIAGLGELVPSVSLYQTGSVNFSCGPDQWTTVDITLNRPMPDPDYVVVMDSAQTAYAHVQAVTYKTTTGFTAIIYNRDALSGNGIINWQAFKLMTDQQTALDEAQITKNKNNTAATFSTSTSYAVGSYCIYDGNLYRCTTAHSGAWNASHFTATSVGGTLGSIVPSDASSSNKLVTSSAVATKTISGVTPTVYQSVGTIATTNFCQAGKFVMGRISMTGATLTSHGATTLILRLPDSVPQPMFTVDAIGTYYNNTVDAACHCRLGSDRRITVYSNLRDGETVTNVDVWLTVMYIAR